MASTVRIDFSRPIALFPLPAVVVYPQCADWIVAFEPRYRQLVEDCLRACTAGELLTAAPIAMATYAPRGWKGERFGDPPLRPAVCVTKIVEHRALPDGRHQILLHGVSRAAIEQVAEPDGRRLYRLARLQPLDARPAAPRRLPELSAMLGEILAHPQLRRMPRFEQLRGFLGRTGVPTEAIVEQLLFGLLRDEEERYAMLAEPNARARARFVLGELGLLARLIDHAFERAPASPSRGVHLN